MSEEPHAVVRLLLKRMESHPEEFKRVNSLFGSRWSGYVNDIEELGSETDKAAIGKAIQTIRMDEIHEAVMDELLNGPERRRKQAEEEHKSVAMQLQQLQQNRQSQAANMYGATGLQQSSLGSLGVRDHNAYLSQGYGLTSVNPTPHLTTGTTTTSVTDTTWGAAQINSLKKALGL
jgi:hypothetical protein